MHSYLSTYLPTYLLTNQPTYVCTWLPARYGCWTPLAVVFLLRVLLLCAGVKGHSVVSPTRRPKHRPHHTITFILVTPNKSSPNFEKPYSLFASTLPSTLSHILVREFVPLGLWAQDVKSSHISEGSLR